VLGSWNGLGHGTPLYAYVLVNGSIASQHSVLGNQRKDFDLSLTLLAGQTVDFVVSLGDGSDFYNGNLALQAGISTGRYRFTFVDYPGANRTRAYGVNAKAEVVGDYRMPGSSIFHGFKLSKGSFTTIDCPGATASRVTGINDLGDIVGECTIDGALVGFIVKAGQFSLLQVPGATTTQAAGINNLAVVVGTFGDDSGTLRGFRLENGQYSTIDVPNAVHLGAQGINSVNTIVGTYDQGDLTTNHGYILSRTGSLQLIDHPEATDATALLAINDRAQIAGSWAVAPGALFHGLLLESGVFLTIDVPSGIQTIARGINNRGQIVGTVNNVGPIRGFLATPND
jgi:uncharacterized membrane protein